MYSTAATVARPEVTRRPVADPAFDSVTQRGAVAADKADRAGVPTVTRFGRYSLDQQRRQLLADGQAVPIGGRAFDLLDELVRHAGSTLSTEALRRAVWPDRKVGDNNLRVQITALRKLLGEGAITLHGNQGYRFTLPLIDDGDSDGSGSDAGRPGNLSRQATRLYGRDEDLWLLSQRLVGQARITVVGPAGVGKTVLSRAAALSRRADTADGVWWVDLAPLVDPAELVARIASMLQVKLPVESPSAHLVESLSDKQMLLVLDNCEHLSEAARALVDALLPKAPRVAVLATSRRPLKCAGEQLMRLGSLGLPEATGLSAARSSGAVAWFEARARSAEPDFAVTADNVDAVVELCRSLDGLPMAIGLAAARVPLLGVAGLRDRLADRLRLLTSAQADPRGHPQTLCAALDWSHELLDGPQRTVLRRLGVFAGSFGLASVQAVACDDRLDADEVFESLEALVEHSLVLCEPAPLQLGAPRRYSMHESVRLYARQRLEASGESDRLRARHARHMLALAAGSHASSSPSSPSDKMDLMLPDADHDNLRTALAWAREHDFALALELATQVNSYMRKRGHHLEARRNGEALLQDPAAADHPDALARLKLAQAAICFEQSDMDLTLQFAHGALDTLATRPHDDWLLGDAWSWIGIAHQMRDELDLAEPALVRAMAHNRASGRPGETATQLNNLGLVMMERRRFDEARALFEEALALNREVNRQWGMAVTLENLGELAYAQGDARTALAHWLDAVPLMRQLGHIYQQALLEAYMGMALRHLGQPEAALLHARESLRISLAQQLVGVIADGLTLLSALAMARRDFERAALLLCMADNQRGTLPAIGPSAVDRREIEALVRPVLGETAWQAARLDADRLTPAEVLD